MVVKIERFESLEGIENALDKEISEIKSVLSNCLQRLDGIRSLGEKTRKIRRVVGKLAGTKAVSESSGELSVDGFNVVLDTGPFDELTALERVVRSHQELLLNLQKAREALTPLEQLSDTDGMKYLVVESNGVPESVLLKVC